MLARPEQWLEDLLKGPAHADTAKGLESAALEKATFLQDALIFALREHHVSTETTLNFEFRKELNGLAAEPPGQNYFFAMALAKLFRALMLARIPSGGLPWGSHFSYFRNHTLLPKRGRLRDNWHRLLDNIKRTRAKARHKTFVAPARTEPTEAARLAEKLLQRADVFFDFYRALIPNEQNALRAATLQDAACDPQQLLPVWNKADSRRYRCLPLDKLWTRDTNCYYLQHCIGFGEFAALEIHGAGDDQMARLADDRMRYLREEEDRLAETDRLVARNWWCRGFMRGMYSWQRGTKIQSTQRNVFRNIVDDVDTVVETIEEDATYKRVSAGHVVRTRNHHTDITRAACEGASIDDIWGRFGLPKREILSFLLAVATTTPKRRKLEECWR